MMENELTDIMKDGSDPIKATYTFGDNDNRETISVKNTYQLQLTSLLIFATAIDYMYDPVAETDGGVFIYVGEGKTDFGIVKFNTMRDWYNHSFMRGSFHGWHGFEKELPECAKRLRLNPLKMTTAVNSKLIRQVFLQSDRAKNLTVQKHIITESDNIHNILSRGSEEEVDQLEEVCDWKFNVEDVKEEEK